MADLPRLNGIISVLESGRTPITAFSAPTSKPPSPTPPPPTTASCSRWSTAPTTSARSATPSSTCSTARQIVQRAPSRPPSRPWSASRRTAASRTSGSPSRCSTRRLRHRLAPRQHRRGRLQRGRRLPLPAARKTRPNYEPEGQRGDAPRAAARYWGLTSRNTTSAPTSGRSNPDGEVWSSSCARRSGRSTSCRASSRRCPGIGVVLIGEGDLSQNLGYPRQYEHPAVVEAIDDILRDLQGAATSSVATPTSTRNAGRLVEGATATSWPPPRAATRAWTPALRAPAAPPPPEPRAPHRTGTPSADVVRRCSGAQRPGRAAYGTAGARPPPPGSHRRGRAVGTPRCGVAPVGRAVPAVSYPYSNPTVVCFLRAYHGPVRPGARLLLRLSFT